MILAYIRVKVEIEVLNNIINNCSITPIYGGASISRFSSF
jgi:hypothetical protein